MYLTREISQIQVHKNEPKRKNREITEDRGSDIK